MTTHTFARFDLRTTDPDAARRFYAAVLGLAFDAPAAAEAAPLAVWPLHEQARARGAPAHWLGSIGVTDVDATLRRWLDLGSESLGPVVRAADGSPFAVLRDPLGAVMAVRAGIRTPQRSPVAWHQLHTKDVDRAWAIYSEQLGWSPTKTVEVPDLEGGLRMFAWEAGGKTVGAMGNTARWPGVHVHWLFYFSIADLDDAIAKLRANAGNSQSPIMLPNGNRIAACEDPQGAAFGLFQPA
jgi:predicted enzyme related to lactoylglutathione lyase